MTPERLQQLIEMTGEDRVTVSRVLGFASVNSLRQCLDGKATLKPDKVSDLEAYAKFRAKQVAAREAWIEKNLRSKRK